VPFLRSYYLKYSGAWSSSWLSDQHSFS